MNTSDDQTCKRPRRRRHWARRTHRVVAIGAFSFLIVIAITGLLLNHADEFGLTRGHVSSGLASRLYGIEAPPVDSAFEASGFVFATVSDAFYADYNRIANDTGETRGAVASNDMIVIATQREFILMTENAVLVERSVRGSSQVLNRIGSDGSRVVVDMADGYWNFDPDQMRMTTRNATTDGIAWSEPISLNDDQLRRIGNAAVAQVISWERLFSDLHSGRILPTVGRYIFDITALCLLYLCMSGVVLWFRKR